MRTLDNKIDSNHEELTARFDATDIRLSNIENKVDSIGTQLSEVLTLLKK
jgi:hypothetical protein